MHLCKSLSYAHRMFAEQKRSARVAQGTVKTNSGFLNVLQISQKHDIIGKQTMPMQISCEL